MSQRTMKGRVRVKKEKEMRKLKNQQNFRRGVAKVGRMIDVMSGNKLLRDGIKAAKKRREEMKNQTRGGGNRGSRTR